MKDYVFWQSVRTAATVNDSPSVFHSARSTHISSADQFSNAMSGEHIASVKPDLTYCPNTFSLSHSTDDHLSLNIFVFP